MARDQDLVTDEEIAALRKEMNDQGDDIRDSLAEDLGGESEDYDAGKHLRDRAGEPVADGGE